MDDFILSQKPIVCIMQKILLLALMNNVVIHLSTHTKRTTELWIMNIMRRNFKFMTHQEEKLQQTYKHLQRQFELLPLSQQGHEQIELQSRGHHRESWCEAYYISCICISNRMKPLSVFVSRFNCSSDVELMNMTIGVTKLCSVVQGGLPLVSHIELVIIWITRLFLI